MSDLERKIRKAAERLIASFSDGRPDRELSVGESFNRSCATPLSYYCLASPGNILTLLAAKDAEIERLRDGVKGLQQEVRDAATEARWAERQGEDYGSY